MAQITGIGGIFFKSADPKALGAWYREVLGLDVQDWGGALLPYDAPKHPAAGRVVAVCGTTRSISRRPRASS